MKNQEVFEIRCRERDTFEKKLVPMEIEVIAGEDGITLQKATNNSTGKVHFKLFWDGECLSTIYSEKEAFNLLYDFCPNLKKHQRKAEREAKKKG